MGGDGPGQPRVRPQPDGSQRRSYVRRPHWLQRSKDGRYPSVKNRQQTTCNTVMMIDTPHSITQIVSKNRVVKNAFDTRNSIKFRP